MRVKFNYVEAKKYGCLHKKTQSIKTTRLQRNFNFDRIDHFYKFYYIAGINDEDEI